jgi:hypothetical protein
LRAPPAISGLKLVPIEQGKRTRISLQEATPINLLGDGKLNPKYDEGMFLKQISK